MLAGCALELAAAPNMNGVDAGAGVLAGCALEVAAPNWKGEAAGAGVLAGCALEVAPPKVKGVDAGAGVLATFAAELVVPNIFEGGALEVPNMLEDGAALAVPNMPPVLAELDVLMFEPRPANGLLGVWLLKTEPPPPPNAIELLPLPFMAGMLLAPKGLLLPAVKLKSFAAGGWGLKPVLWLDAPKAGNDELLKVLLGAADWAGGKLLVAPPPKALLPAPNMPLVVPPTAGADAPKLKLLDGAEPKFALCEGVCICALAMRVSWARRIARLLAGVSNVCEGIASAVAAHTDACAKLTGIELTAAPPAGRRILAVLILREQSVSR